MENEISDNVKRKIAEMRSEQRPLSEYVRERLEKIRRKLKALEWPKLLK